MADNLDDLINKFNKLEKAIGNIDGSTYTWDGKRNKFVSGNYDLFSESLLRKNSPLENSNLSPAERDLIAQIQAKINDVLR